MLELPFESRFRIKKLIEFGFEHSNSNIELGHRREQLGSIGGEKGQLGLRGG